MPDVTWVDNVPQAEISMPDSASAGDKMAFSQCTIFARKGSSFQVRCQHCGLRVTTSSHKMMYTHYLREGKGVAACVTLDKLRHDAPDFMKSIEMKQSQLHAKRR
jgi:hypothetical protein